MTRRGLTSGAWMTLLVVHRYLGVAVALVMLLWCLSGFVMMYHGYPRLAEADRLKALQPVRLRAACDPARLGLAAGVPVSSFSLEMAGERPLLQLHLQAAAPVVLDLFTCARAESASPVEARATAQRFAAIHGVRGAPEDRGVIAYDQWTVNGASGRGPVRRFHMDDREHTDIYVAERTGQVAQRTTRTDRVLGWLGAVPHWLYPTILRRDGELWSQVVIYTSLLGVFLTATGLYVGVARLKPYKSGRWSPYRGWFYWHHMLGLVFGLLTLTWVASGLLTMSPWGLLDSPALGQWRHHLAGEASGAQAGRFLTTLAGRPHGAVRYESAPLGGHLFVIAYSADGAPTRLDADGRPTPLTQEALEQALAGAGAPVTPTRLLTGDAYYYAGYDTPAPLPVLKAQLHDREATALYLDPTSGTVLRAVDSAERWGRWTRTALHDWDFPILRRRPLWDVVLLLLLAGVTATCATGSWLALRRVGGDIHRLRVAQIAKLSVARRAFRARGGDR